MKNFDWEDAFFSLLWVACTLVLTIIGFAAFSKKYTKQYSLGVNGGRVTITKESDWYQDDEIPLDRSVTYSEAIRMVDSLNKTLHKK